MQDITPALTERQRYWLEHIQACQQSGQTMADYAAAHGFTARAMYEGKKILVKKGVLPAQHAPRFQRIRVIEAPVSSQWRIGLPNGVSVAFAGDVAVSQALVEGVVATQVRSLLWALGAVVAVAGLLGCSLRWGLYCVIPCAFSAKTPIMAKPRWLTEE